MGVEELRGVPTYFQNILIPSQSHCGRYIRFKETVDVFNRRNPSKCLGISRSTSEIGFVFTQAVAPNANLLKIVAFDTN